MNNFTIKKKKQKKVRKTVKKRKQKGGFDPLSLAGIAGTAAVTALTTVAINKAIEFKNHFDAINGYKQTLKITNTNYQNTFT